ncbi:hypothetical protein AAE02nite_10050 [Adhaeribacter aerolatus]|uniref:Iron dicitrate transporter FecR n=1 Tax=Adhaeribacter aerolatus TaxID=670289 RepID=A0A512AUG0_9BACT|nr:FecR domain-containing protein [Adhaeribacter aerolatus]GEO03341.1 hypothetical protein AAE02nite_10050 [Adhaeribacter aerolatus]
MAENYIPFLISELILKSLSQTLTPQEQEILDNWLATDAQNSELLDLFRQEQRLEPELTFFSSLNTENAWQKIAAKTVNSAPPVSLWQKPLAWRFAAAVALLMGIAIVFALVKFPDKAPAIAVNKPKEVRKEVKTDINQVKLSLADGTEILLNDIADGTVQEINGIKIEKKDGQVIFRVADNTVSQPKVAYNIITTPIGEQYQVVLPDGSKVWLNSASALRFPTAFPGHERAVTLTGEGYFEITKKKDQPFLVTASNTTIEVLGTHFNLMAYPNESATKTTLLEGSVKVSNGKVSEFIKPGQQANVTDAIKLSAVDVDEAIAWKNGLFHFNDADLKTIARQLERWYNVDISFGDEVPGGHFTGIISRRTDIEQVLKMLQVSGNLDYKIKERRVLISAKKKG